MTEQQDPIQWSALSDQAKVRHILESVMQCRTYDWMEFIDAPITHYPVAFWEVRRATWMMLQVSGEGGEAFDPLHSMADAWRVIERLNHRASMVWLPDEGEALAKAMVWVSSEKLISGCATTMPEAICIAALRASGVEVSA